MISLIKIDGSEKIRILKVPTTLLLVTMRRFGQIDVWIVNYVTMTRGIVYLHLVSTRLSAVLQIRMGSHFDSAQAENNRDAFQ